jgi:hypothetical protein
VNVSTAYSLAGAYAVEVGMFNGTAGVFVTVDATLKFISGLDTDLQSAPIVNVVGSALKSSLDGDFASAEFESLGRMVYNASADVLFVCDDESSIIRIVDFSSQEVSTVSSSDNSSLVFLHPFSVYSFYGYGGRFPGMGLASAGAYLYVTDRLQVYNLTRDGSSSSSSHYVRQTYTTLSEYMSVHSWPSRSLVLGIAVDEARGMIYAAVSFAVNVLLQMPMQASHHSEITVLAGDSSLFYEGNGASLTTPYALDGYGTSALLAFPSSLSYDVSSDALFFTEAFTEFSFPSVDSLVGSLSVRRYSLSSGELRSYAGEDFSEADAEYLVSGGYRDGRGSTSQFRYPLTVTTGFTLLGAPVLYVTDFFNNAIRSVYRAPVHSPTGEPSGQPTGIPIPSGKPSGEPSVEPTHSPTVTPTATPSIAPSVSLRPTTASGVKVCFMSAVEICDLDDYNVGDVIQVQCGVRRLLFLVL